MRKQAKYLSADLARHLRVLPVGHAAGPTPIYDVYAAQCLGLGLSAG